MQFFKHSTGMRNDIKMKRTFKRYGLEGYGLYNLIVESIADALSSDRPIPELEETAQDIAEQYHGDTAHINEMMAFMINQGLFEINELTGRVLCSKIYRFLDKSQTRSAEIRAMIDNYKQQKQICHVVSDSLNTAGGNSDRVEVEIDKEIEIEKKGRFTPPTPDEVKAYLLELKETRISPQSFCDYYESKGWMIGKNKMKSWKAAVRTWINSENNRGTKQEFPNM